MPQELNSFIDALPIVATKPLALLGYLAVLVSWVLIAFRVRRYQLLLKYIEKLPAKDRRNALRDEMGSVPSGEDFDPDFYLHRQINQYLFIGFALICVVILIIVVVAYTSGTNSVV